MGDPILSTYKQPFLISKRHAITLPESGFKLMKDLQDCNDRDPLVRALAIRTMSYIALPMVLQALKDPLRQCLKDKDPYVRKTAAICVAKLYVHDPHMVIRENLFELLRDLLTDDNATVVANTVVALTEISDRSEESNFTLNLHTASKLISALGDCSEYVIPYIAFVFLLTLVDGHKCIFWKVS